uniref:laforin n=1 Tax=Myxine glutinosa TaxID=7769 RepID=UPI00358F90D6
MATVTFRFSVVTTVGPETQLMVVGSPEQMGHWEPDSAVHMHAFRDVISSAEPSFWQADVPVSEKALRETIYFKFLKRVNGEIIWEGRGSQDDRHCDYDDANVVDGVHCFPACHWIESWGHSNEMHHTTNFYFNIADHQAIHFSRILHCLWLGSCPRQKEHVTTILRHDLAVTAIMNFQTEHDLATNSAGCAPGQQVTVDTMSALCHQAEMVYIWIPTPDMSTEGRIRMLPQAVFLLHGLLECGHTVYVHCNAGVGRAAAAIAGYLRYILGWSARRCEYFLRAHRPAVYLDEEALEMASGDFAQKFGHVRRCINEKQEVRAF